MNPGTHAHAFDPPCLAVAVTVRSASAQSDYRRAEQFLT
jgi:hypothetical protein